MHIFMLCVSIRVLFIQCLVCYQHLGNHFFLNLLFGETRDGVWFRRGSMPRTCTLSVRGHRRCKQVTRVKFLVLEKFQFCTERRFLLSEDLRKLQSAPNVFLCRDVTRIHGQAIATCLSLFKDLTLYTTHCFKVKRLGFDYCHWGVEICQKMFIQERL